MELKKRLHYFTWWAAFFLLPDVSLDKSMGMCHKVFLSLEYFKSTVSPQWHVKQVTVNTRATVSYNNPATHTGANISCNSPGTYTGANVSCNSPGADARATTTNKKVIIQIMVKLELILVFYFFVRCFLFELSIWVNVWLREICLGFRKHLSIYMIKVFACSSPKSPNYF